MLGSSWKAPLVVVESLADPQEPDHYCASLADACLRQRETERGLISHSSSLYVAVSLHNRNPIQTRRGARVLQGRADSTYSSSARLLCFLQKAHFSSTLIQDGKAAVYSCQTQSLAPYSLKKRASTMMIFEPSFSL